MKEHNHEECKHVNLGYCAKCDCVYCKDCGIEWVKPHWQYSYTTTPLTGTCTGGNCSNNG
jgi:hypothetical protein